jgi:hypothetical protein
MGRHVNDSYRERHLYATSSQNDALSQSHLAADKCCDMIVLTVVIQFLPQDTKYSNRYAFCTYKYQQLDHRNRLRSVAHLGPAGGRPWRISNQQVRDGNDETANEYSEHSLPLYCEESSTTEP